MNEQYNGNVLTAGMGISDQGRASRTYSYSEQMAIQGKVKDGKRITVNYDTPSYGLSVDERIDIFRYCSPVFGIISGRMNRISSYKWSVCSDKKNEDRTSEYLKTLWEMYTEIPDIGIPSITAKASIVAEVRKSLPDVLPDMSNFQPALMRWGRRIKSLKVDKCSEIEDWLSHPNAEDDWTSFIKKWVFDFHVHGMSAIYKEVLDNRLENIHMLPGGSVFPVRSRRIGGYSAFAQMVSGVDINIYFGDEISAALYMPTSAFGVPFVPLEAVTNKVAESLMFDKLMADQADGTKPTEKVVMISRGMPFGDTTVADLKMDVPITVTEQKKIETMMNERKKNAVRVLTGYGNPSVLDLSRENTMSVQLERQKMIREEVALVFGASNLEVNLTGSESTSGRSTAEAQEREGFEKSTLPILSVLETKFKDDIIPYRFGRGYSVEFQGAKNEMEQYQLYQAMLNTGLWSVNEIRTEELNRTPFKGKDYDLPINSQSGSSPDGSAISPINIKQL